MCTSIQLLLVQRSIVDEVQARLAKLVSALPYGDPYDPKTFVGPLISEDNAIRIDAWIDGGGGTGRAASRGRQARGRGGAADAARGRSTTR